MGGKGGFDANLQKPFPRSAMFTFLGDVKVIIGYLIINIYIMETDKKNYTYKIRRLSLEKEERYDGEIAHYIKVTMVARFKWWKFDKFIPMREAIQLLDWLCFTDKDKDLVMSKAERKLKRSPKLF